LRTGHQHLSDSPAFTLVETIVAMAVLGVVVVALYSGMAQSALSVRLMRENIRATQIMVEKMEVIRTFNWDQINSDGFVPTNFLSSYMYNGTNSTNLGAGPIYTGGVSIVKVPVSVSQNYTNDLRMVTINLSWSSAGISRTRQLSTYVSRYGIQNSLYY
jgi:prepilin-type N-terminal cleavage/methylation domain-containing protein